MFVGKKEEQFVDATNSKYPPKKINYILFLMWIQKKKQNNHLLD